MCVRARLQLSVPVIYVASRNSDEKLKELLSKVNDRDEELGLLTCIYPFLLYGAWHCW